MSPSSAIYLVPSLLPLYAKRTDLAPELTPTTEVGQKALLLMLPTPWWILGLRSPQTMPPWERLTPVRRQETLYQNSFILDRAKPRVFFWMISSPPTLKNVNILKHQTNLNSLSLFFLERIWLAKWNPNSTWTRLTMSSVSTISALRGGIFQKCDFQKGKGNQRLFRAAHTLDYWSCLQVPTKIFI